MTESHGFLCGPKVYKFEGWEFEVSGGSGPWPVTIGGDPYNRAGRVFYAMIRRFYSLPETEQESHRIGGGCRAF
jgi:hypothetical protein